MDLDAFGDLAESSVGVRRVRSDGPARWEFQGRLIARELDPSHVVIRVPFEVRDVLMRLHPIVFTIPNRFAKHMMLVADLAVDDAAAVEEALDAAWRHQSSG